MDEDRSSDESRPDADWLQHRDRATIDRDRDRLAGFDSIEQ
jgi:hypothetical protein